MNKITSNPAISSSWADVRTELFTTEEIAESDLRVASLGELIKERAENGNKSKEH